MLGLAAGVALMVLAEYLDDSIRCRADVESLGIPVLVEVPRE
jgi:capsular polysaccharide biosynthesis protein